MEKILSDKKTTYKVAFFRESDIVVSEVNKETGHRTPIASFSYEELGNLFKGCDEYQFRDKSNE